MSDGYRPTARELANRTSGIAGKSAESCPYCGSRLDVDKTTALTSTIERYVYCRNEQCGAGFITRQPPAVIVREVSQRRDVKGK